MASSRAYCLNPQLVQTDCKSCASPLLLLKPTAIYYITCAASAQTAARDFLRNAALRRLPEATAKVLTGAWKVLACRVLACSLGCQASRKASASLGCAGANCPASLTHAFACPTKQCLSYNPICFACSGKFSIHGYWPNYDYPGYPVRPHKVVKQRISGTWVASQRAHSASSI